MAILKFNKVSRDAFSKMQLGAGMLLKTFNPASPAAPADADIVTATTGGLNITATPSYIDQAEDVDNVPNNMKEYKTLDYWECKITTTALTVDAETIKLALGAADLEVGTGHVTPRAELKQTDFIDELWWVGNTVDKKIVAVELINALSTGGFSLQTNKTDKGQLALEMTGHVSVENQEEVPMDFYVLEQAG